MHCPIVMNILILFNFWQIFVSALSVAVLGRDAGYLCCDGLVRQSDWQPVPDLSDWLVQYGIYCLMNKNYEYRKISTIMCTSCSQLRYRGKCCNPIIRIWYLTAVTMAGGIGACCYWWVGNTDCRWHWAINRFVCSCVYGDSMTCWVISRSASGLAISHCCRPRRDAWL